MSAYLDFLARKAITDPPTGIEPTAALPAALFPFQADITKWALRRGRAALFAGTGLGKSLMELAWAEAVHRATGKDILHLAPLAVSNQLAREAEKFGIAARVVASGADREPGINITNYQKLPHFDVSTFGGVILDESSILKSTDGHYRTSLIEACQAIPFRLAATATPAPNDFMELGNHAEFLGIMSYTDMLATFFTHDNGDTQKWRLKGHAENEFWKWMASWAVMLRKPSDLGYSDEGYDLPPLNFIQHTACVDYAPSIDTGLLFPMQAETLQERIGARRATVEQRVALAASVTPSDRPFEQFYQAVRRFWRFGQTKPVTCHIISSEIEGATVANIRRKEADAERMAAAMVLHMADLSTAIVRGSVRDRPNYNPQQPVKLPAFLEVA
jgi:hypothetical protein